MTSAVFIRDGNTFTAIVSGHAGHNVSGTDIVCASCSILACTLRECMLGQEEAGGITAFHCDPDGDGRFALSVTACDSAVSSVHSRFDTIVTGFRMLADEYPDNVSIVATDNGKKWGETILNQ